MRVAPSFSVAVLVATIGFSSPARAQTTTGTDAGTTAGTTTTSTTNTTAQPNITGFEIISIEPVGNGFSLDDRLVPGASGIEDEHRVNAADCPIYNGETPAPGDPPCTLDPDAPSIRVTWRADDSISGLKWTAKIGTCSSSSDLLDEPTGCKLLTPSEGEVGSRNEFTVALAPLIGTLETTGTDVSERRCCSNLDGLTGEVRLWVFTAQPDLISGNDQIVSDSILFRWDYDPPAAPAGVQLRVKGETLRVDWDPVPEDAASITYLVYWDTVPFDSAEAAAHVKEVSGSSSSAELTGLTPGETVFVRVAARDDFDNEGPLSAAVSGAPIETFDGWEYYKAQGGKAEGGFCFVATAAWGTPMAPALHWLRAFRDHYLLTWSGGRAFVAWYYRHAPPWAEFIRRRPIVRALARVALWPAVGLAWGFERGGPVLASLVLLALLGGAFFAIRYRRRLRGGDA